MKSYERTKGGEEERVTKNSSHSPTHPFSLSEFDYDLPKELIAAFPPEDRPSARLLHVSRQTGEFSHHVFRDIKSFLRAGDLLVLNNTKVRPARLFGKKVTGGVIEALLLKEVGGGEWKTLLRPGGRIRKGTSVFFGENGTSLEAEVLDDPSSETGERHIRFIKEPAEISAILKKIGHMPLPPYIDRPDTVQDREVYQTVFAEKEGAVASPTAGLHFDKALLQDLESMGVQTTYVTLHTGYGTFQPVTDENVEKRQLHSEEFEVTEETAKKINAALKEGRRVIACGTTSVRVLETVGIPLRAIKGETRLFVYPPYDFKVVSGMITNFHVPKSSLLLLVAAFLGKEKMDAAYAEAIREKYRFYSYGDAMLIL